MTNRLIQLVEPAPGAHTPADLPAVLTTISTRAGARLEVRLVQAGQRYGLNGQLPERAAWMVEVRLTDRIRSAFGYAGEVIALTDLDQFLDDPATALLILGPGLRHEVTAEALFAAFLVVQDAAHATTDPTVDRPAEQAVAPSAL